MINVEFNVKQFNQIVISLDFVGTESLASQLEYLLNRNDHFHVLCQSWSSHSDEALSEKILSGKEFHWCHELDIGTSVHHEENGSNDDIDVYVDAVIADKEYSVLQVSIIRTQVEIKTLLASLKEISLAKKEFTISTKALFTAKHKFHLTKKQHHALNVTFKYLQE